MNQRCDNDTMEKDNATHRTHKFATSTISFSASKTEEGLKVRNISFYAHGSIWLRVKGGAKIVKFLGSTAERSQLVQQVLKDHVESDADFTGCGYRGHTLYVLTD